MYGRPHDRHHSDGGRTARRPAAQRRPGRPAAAPVGGEAQRIPNVNHWTVSYPGGAPERSEGVGEMPDMVRKRSVVGPRIVLLLFVALAPSPSGAHEQQKIRLPYFPWAGGAAADYIRED